MGRKSPRLTFNATSIGDPSATAAESQTAAQATSEHEMVQDTLAADQAMAEEVSRRVFMARANTVPTVTDNLNERTRTRFMRAGETRGVSTYKRKRYSAERNNTFDAASVARKKSLTKLRDDTAGRIGDLSETLREVKGDSRMLETEQQRTMRDIDLTIRTAEAGNTREHTVYVATDISSMPGDTPQDRLEAVKERLANDQGHYVVHGYMVGSHDMGEVVNEGSDNEVVLEIKTASGVYLGNSDGQGRTASHLLARERHLLPVSVQENVAYERPDGSLGRRTIIQMQDVTPNIWEATHS